MRSWTWPFGETDGQYGGLRTGSGLELQAFNSAEGQERASRERDENLRLLYVGCTRARDKLVFAHREGKYAWLEQLSAVDAVLNCSLGDGEHELDGIETSFVLRSLSADMVDDCRVEESPKQRWLAFPGNHGSSEFGNRFHSPSHASPAPGASAVHSEELPGCSYFPSGADATHYASIGDAVHAYLAALPSLNSVNHRAKESVAERCLAAFSVTGILAPADVVASGERFLKWVSEHFPGAQWHAEIMAGGSRVAGGCWRGTIDLLLRLPTGKVIVIDHKSAPVRRNHCEAKALQFTGQVNAYREVLESAGESVQGSWIHFPLAGVMVRLT